MNNYESVYKNTGTVPRTMHRVEDHYTLHYFKSENDDAKRFFKDFVVTTLVIALIGLIGYAVWQLVTMQ